MYEFDNLFVFIYIIAFVYITKTLLNCFVQIIYYISVLFTDKKLKMA